MLFADGERRYIIAPKGAVVGQAVANGPEAPIKAGNNLPIRNIPVGTTIHCVEILPGKGANRPFGWHLRRAAGSRRHLRSSAPALG